MTSITPRKRQPEKVRRAVLDCAARIAVEQGLSKLSIQAVAEAAGVTKGGLFHHFSNRSTLINAMFADLLQKLDDEIDSYLSKGDDPHGRFTRAYVEATFADRRLVQGDPWVALSISMVIEPDLRPLWSKWLNDRLELHAETDKSLQLEIVRLAADGFWLACTSHLDDDLVSEPSALRARLIEMTRQH